jgi:hypothetical protein
MLVLQIDAPRAFLHASVDTNVGATIIGATVGGVMVVSTLVTKRTLLLGEGSHARHVLFVLPLSRSNRACLLVLSTLMP